MDNQTESNKFETGMKQFKGFFNPFRSFLLAIIILTMYNNLEHSASVYLSIAANSKYSDWYNTIQSYMVVIVIDLAVIAFIISSKKKESKIFAWVLFAINCLFFNVFQSVYFIYNEFNSLNSNIASPVQIIAEANGLIAKIVFSGLFSYCIHRFSFLWFERKPQHDLTGELEIKEKMILEIREDHKRLDADLNALKLKHIEVMQETIEIVSRNNTLIQENESLKAKLTRKKDTIKI